MINIQLQAKILTLVLNFKLNKQLKLKNSQNVKFQITQFYFGHNKRKFLKIYSNIGTDIEFLVENKCEIVGMG